VLHFTIMKPLKKKEYKNYILYENESGTTYHVARNDELTEEYIRDQMALKERAAKDNIGAEELITYKLCRELGFCDVGIRVFARVAKIPEDKIEEAVLTQEEFDSIVTKYQRVFLEDGTMLREIHKLSKNVKWDMDLIKSNASYAYFYLRYIVRQRGKRLPEFEETLKKSAPFTYLYLRDIVCTYRQRLPEFEDALKKSPEYTYWYLRFIVRQLGERMPEFEHYYHKYRTYIVDAGRSKRPML